MTKTNKDAAHKMIGLAKISVCQLDDDGNRTDRMVDTAEMAKYGLKDKMIVHVSGEDRHTCLTKLAEIIKPYMENQSE